MVKVSVIVPVYNVAKFLPQCIDSLIGQTLRDIEIICVNDGSTDNSLEILQKYADMDSRIKIINQNNMGLGGARNTGLACANGEYVGFVDSDDWVDSDWYEKLYVAAKKSNADIVRGLISKEFPNGTSEPHYFNKVLHNCVAKNIDLTRRAHPVVVWNSIYKRSLLTDNHIKFIVDYVHEDIPFQFQVSYYANKFIPVDDVTYHYRQNRIGQLSETNMRSIVGTFYANHYLLDFINNVPCKNRADYTDVVSRCVWRADYKFMYGVQNIADFSADRRREFFDMWRQDLLRCEYPFWLKIRYRWLHHVLSGNMQKYIRTRVHDDFAHRVSRFFRRLLCK